ncbi:Uncharacterised protein [Raoultella planticola]|nr:Uncharacterised protein [Raoultella planticola]
MQEELQRSSPYVFVDQGKTQIVVRDNVKGYQQGLNADMVWYDNVTKVISLVAGWRYAYPARVLVFVGRVRRSRPPA